MNNKLSKLETELDCAALIHFSLSSVEPLKPTYCTGLTVPIQLYTERGIHHSVVACIFQLILLNTVN